MLYLLISLLLIHHRNQLIILLRNPHCNLRSSQLRNHLASPLIGHRLNLLVIQRFNLPCNPAINLRLNRLYSLQLFLLDSQVACRALNLWLDLLLNLARVQQCNHRRNRVINRRVNHLVNQAWDLQLSPVADRRDNHPVSLLFSLLECLRLNRLIYLLDSQLRDQATNLLQYLPTNLLIIRLVNHRHILVLSPQVNLWLGRLANPVFYHRVCPPVNPLANQQLSRQVYRLTNRLRIQHVNRLQCPVSSPLLTLHCSPPEFLLANRLWFLALSQHPSPLDNLAVNRQLSLLITLRLNL